MARIRSSLFTCKALVDEKIFLVGDGRHLRSHFLDLRVCQGLNAEVVILLKLIFHEVVAPVNLCDYVLIHNLIARQLQKVKSADGIVALAFERFKPLLYLFSKFVVHYNLLLMPVKNTRL